MASGIGKLVTGVDARCREFDWWKHHVFFFAALLLVLPVVLVSFYGLRGVYLYFGIEPVVRFLANGVMYLVGLVVIVTVVASLPGYYYDAQQLKADDSGYTPRWLLYSVIHVIPPFGPFVAIPLYVVQRWRHVGIPMQRLFSFRRS